MGSEPTDEMAATMTQKIQQLYQLPATILPQKRKNSSSWDFYIFSRKMLSIAKKQILQIKPDIVYTRNIYNVKALNKIAKKNNAILVFDVRGVVAQESRLKHGLSIKYYFILYKELTAIKTAERISCVSYNLKKWIEDKTARTDAFVIPSCVDTEKFIFNPESRKIIRKKFNIADTKIVFCYSGGLSKWQKIESIISLFEKIAQKLSNSSFLFLTPAKNQLKQIIENSKLPLTKCTITSCDHNDIPAYLSSADLGIIMRDNTIINNVASPVKIGELLACGLPLILTDGIGDYSQKLSKAGIGILINESQNPSEQVLKFIRNYDFKELKFRAIKFAEENISWNSQLEKMKQLFNI